MHESSVGYITSLQFALNWDLENLMFSTLNNMCGQVPHTRGSHLVGRANIATTKPLQTTYITQWSQCGFFSLYNHHKYLTVLPL